MVDLIAPDPLRKRMTWFVILVLDVVLVTLIASKREAAWFVFLFPIAIFLFGLVQVLWNQGIFFVTETTEILVIRKIATYTFSTKRYPRSDFEALVVTRQTSSDGDTGYFDITAQGSATLRLASGLSEENVIPRAMQLKATLGLELEGWGCVSPRPFRMQSLPQK